MRSRSKRTISIVFVMLGASVAFFMIRFNELQVGYHRWKMQRSHDSFMAEVISSRDVSRGIIPDGEYQEYEYHRQQLVDLGVVSETTYHFNHILHPSDASHHLSKLFFSSRSPDCIDLSLPSLVEPQPMEMTVWCYGVDKPEWESLIAARDIPNYTERFMTETNSVGVTNDR